MGVELPLVELILAGANVWSLDLSDVFTTGGGVGCPFSGEEYPDGFTYGTGIKVTPNLLFEYGVGSGAGPGAGDGIRNGFGAGDGEGARDSPLLWGHDVEGQMYYGWGWPE